MTTPGTTGVAMARAQVPVGHFMGSYCSIVLSFLKLQVLHSLLVGLEGVLPLLKRLGDLLELQPFVRLGVRVVLFDKF